MVAGWGWGGGRAGTCVSGERLECTPSRQENTLAPVYCEQDRWKGGWGEKGVSGGGGGGFGGSGDR